MKTNTFKEKYEYIDDDLIKRGAFGDVYKIKDKNVKTEYVLKKLIKENPNNPNIKGTDKKSFENELNFLINVKGTNIINIIDYGEDDKYFYLVLEKMEEDLGMMINKYKNGMSSKLIRKIFSQINSGLKIMNDKGKTHRDLKPENILFSYTNDKKTDFIVKIGDFGLSTDIIGTTIASNAGSELFKAPEVEEGKYSNKCDLYSIGIILYMLKTGEYIFEGKTKFDILKNQTANKIKKEIDDENLNKLIKKLVVIDPHKRMEWKEYFDDPFFKVNDEDVKESEECKIKIKILDKKIINEYYENKKCIIFISNISNNRITK